jgi:hypothetical protein
MFSISCDVIKLRVIVTCNLRKIVFKITYYIWEVNKVMKKSSTNIAAEDLFQIQTSYRRLNQTN